MHKHLEDRYVLQNQLAKALKDYEFNHEELHAQYTQLLQHMKSIQQESQKVIIQIYQSIQW